jgi:hypothetical protein
MKNLEESLQEYIEILFEEFFKFENCVYNKKLWTFEWIIIKNNKEGLYHFYPIVARCKYERVLRYIYGMLKINLKSHFGLIYGNTDDFKCSFYENGRINFNYTQAMFKTQNGNISLNVFDRNSAFYEKKGECISDYVFEKLLFNYWQLDADIYNKLSENDEKQYLPQFMQKDWNSFKKLYKKTLKKEVGSEYRIICSSGIKRI